MDDLKIHTLVTVRLRCAPCNKCTAKVNKLKEEMPEVHSIEFVTEKTVTISGAVDPAKVKKELKRKGVKFDILREESSPINNQHHHPQKQSEPPKPSDPKVHKPHDRTEIAGKGTLDGHSIHKHELVKVEALVPKMHQQQKQHLDLVPHHHQPAAAAGILVSDKSISKHEHELELKISNKRFTCDGCKEDGFKSRYRCKGCVFDLHEVCNSPKSTIFPDLLERYAFEFSPKPPPDDDQRLCHGCGRNINGFFYHCKAKRLDLHPCCAKLKARVRNGETILQLRERVSKNCMWCKNKKPPGADPKVVGWSYVSGCKEYNIHIHCVTLILHEAWQKGAMTMDDESSMALEAIDLQRMAIPKGKGGSGRHTEFLKIIGIFRAIVGILFGDPTVFLGSLMLEVLEQLL